MSLFTDTSVLVNLNLEFGALFFLQEVDNIKKKFKAPSVYSGVLGIDFELAVSIVQFIFLKGRSCFPSAAVAGASLYRGLIINRKQKPLWSNTTLQCVVRRCPGGKKRKADKEFIFHRLYQIQNWVSAKMVKFSKPPQCFLNLATVFLSQEWTKLMHLTSLWWFCCCLQLKYFEPWKLHPIS